MDEPTLFDTDEPTTDPTDQVETGVRRFGTVTDSRPVLPYGGEDDPNSGYAAGVATSAERAHRDDADGTTTDRQIGALAYIEAHKAFGANWKELADAFGWHHGQASGVLSVLHKAERIARLTERRDRCFVYVVPEHVNGRDTQAQGRPKAPGAVSREAHDATVRELTEAIRLTVEYVGLDTLPPVEGWSWYDALVKYAPDVARRFAEGRG